MDTSRVERSDPSTWSLVGTRLASDPTVLEVHIVKEVFATVVQQANSHLGDVGPVAQTVHRGGQKNFVDVCVAKQRSRLNESKRFRLREFHDHGIDGSSRFVRAILDQVGPVETRHLGPVVSLSTKQLCFRQLAKPLTPGRHRSRFGAEVESLMSLEAYAVSRSSTRMHHDRRSMMK